jgi:PAS domain S-box-containing protein
MEPTAPSSFLAWLDANKKSLKDSWVRALSGLPGSYRARPSSELIYTVRMAFSANREALATGNLEKIDRFIAYISQKRQKTLFKLSEVQEAFELFRTIVVERLLAPDAQVSLAEAIVPLNALLSHTIHGFSSHFQDIHNQTLDRHARELEKQVQLRTAELQEERKRYKALVEAIDDGFFVVRGGKITFANPAFCRMHGVEEAEVLGRPFFRFVSPASRPAVKNAYRQVMSGRHFSNGLEYTRLGCPRDRAATEIKADLVDLGQGPEAIGICRDISQRLALEVKSREHARLANLVDLTASLSHELRNPLSAIKVNMQILGRKLDLDGYDQRRLEITQKEITRLEEILRRLLDTARPAGQDIVKVDLAEAAKSCLDLLEPRLMEKGIKLTRRFAPDLPPANGDLTGLEQALKNLLLNAMEAVDQGGKITVWTRLVTTGEGSLLEVGVRDNGPGVPPGDIPRLYTPFHTRKSRGTGLGLYNVKRIALAHQGEVVLRNRPGKGASFALRLPCP